MKIKRNVLMIGLLLVTQMVLAKSVVTEFKVYGQCGECKERIEEALDLKGISFATWNTDTKMITVRYSDKKYSEDDIHKIISDLGYKTSKLEANTEAESSLPKCCQPKGGSCGHEKHKK